MKSLQIDTAYRCYTPLLLASCSVTQRLYTGLIQLLEPNSIKTIGVPFVFDVLVWFYLWIV